VTTVPISITNKIGTWIIARGSSFTNASPTARRKIAGSTTALVGRLRDFGGRVSGGGAVAVG
jgi:hypothetical protein